MIKQKENGNQILVDVDKVNEEQLRGSPGAKRRGSHTHMHSHTHTRKQESGGKRCGWDNWSN